MSQVVRLTVVVLCKCASNLTGGDCWFRPFVFSARKDVALTSCTDATAGNRR